MERHNVLAAVPGLNHDPYYHGANNATNDARSYMEGRLRSLEQKIETLIIMCSLIVLLTAISMFYTCTVA